MAASAGGLMIRRAPMASVRENSLHQGKTPTASTANKLPTANRHESDSIGVCLKHKGNGVKQPRNEHDINYFRLIVASPMIISLISMCIFRIRSVLWVSGWRCEFLRTLGFVTAQSCGFSNKHPNHAGYGGECSPFEKQAAKINLDSASRMRIRIFWRSEN
jgi:hypothetical protein